MKVVFDILGSTERSGGMRLHSTELLRSWSEQFLEDDLTIVGGEWAKVEFAGMPVKVVTWPNEHATGRASGQLLFTPIVGLRVNADFVVSLSPIVSPFVARDRAICFQHDWRHKKNPNEFPVHQRAYRVLWQVSAAHAFVNVCISAKAAAETHAYVRRARTVVIENGRDHARRWTVPDTKNQRRHIVTFGHHNNKRPELIIRALAHMRLAAAEIVDLVVLGARGEYADDLRALSSSLGIESQVHLPGFVGEDDYQRIVATSSVVALVSSDEGFGLPIAEAQYFGIPAVVTSDSGMQDLFGEFPIVAAPDAGSVARALVAALASPTSAAGADTGLATWHATAAALRSVLVSQLGAMPHKAA